MIIWRIFLVFVVFWKHLFSLRETMETCYIKIYKKDQATKELTFFTFGVKVSCC